LVAVEDAVNDEEDKSETVENASQETEDIGVQEEIQQDLVTSPRFVFV